MISPSGVEFFGFDTMSEMIGLPVESFWVDPSRRQQALDIIRTKGRVSDFEIRLKRKDGTVFHAAISFHLYRDDAGNVLGTEGIIRDITERKRADEELQEGKAILESLINATTETLLLVDLEGNILVANETVAQRFGKTREELINVCHLDFFLLILRQAEKHSTTRLSVPANRFIFEINGTGRFYDHFVYPFSMLPDR